MKKILIRLLLPQTKISKQFTNWLAKRPGKLFNLVEDVIVINKFLQCSSEGTIGHK